MYYSKLIPDDVKSEFRGGAVDRKTLANIIIEALKGRQSNLNVDALAGGLYVSKRTFSRRLKNEGLTFREVLEESKLTIAKEYLGQDEYSVNLVGRMLGYKDPSNFTKAFKRWTGMTPRQYQKSCRGSICASLLID